MTHGLRRAYQVGCRCLACAAANTAYSASYRAALRRGRPPLGAHVTGRDVQRLVVSLVADGWTRAAIAIALGHTTPRLQYRARVTVRTQLRIRRLQREWTR